MNQDDLANQNDHRDEKKAPESKKKKSVDRSKSFDLKNMFSFKSKNQLDDEVSTAFTSPLNRNLNRNYSEPESNKFNTLRKSIVDRTQSMKKTTADFFGINKEHENEDYQLWLEKRKRFYSKSGGKVKDEVKSVLTSSDTNDSQHTNLFSGDFETPQFNFNLINSSSYSTKPKPSVMKLAIKGIKNIHQINKRATTNLVSDSQQPIEPINEICMMTMKSAEPQEVLFKTYEFDDTSGDHLHEQQPLQPHLDTFISSTEKSPYQHETSTLDAAEFLPNDLVFSYELPRTKTKTWTIVDRGRQRINSKIIESIYDNSDRRQYGMGFLGRLFNRRFRSNLTDKEKEQLNSIYDSRPYFTYWVMSVQFIIMVLALLTYGFGPFGLQKVKISEPVLVNSLSIQEVSYFEPNNIWLGPRPADLIHLGAKYTPCMRKDKLIFDQINREREEEKDTACCIRTDKSGCIQSKKDHCSPLLSKWKKWTEADQITYKTKNNKNSLRTSGSVCGLDPKHCSEPASFFPNIWPDDITKWPICSKQNPKNGYKEDHMSCNLIGKPCCIGIHGECKITTREYCNFVKGFFHEEAALCSQISCMSDVCGMLQIKRDDNLLQIYRLWTSLFLHAGFFHILISFTFQYYIMRDFEKLIGSVRICLIYLISGIGGNLASAIFVPYRAEVGPGGSQFGILAGLVAEQIHSWNLIENPWHQLFKLIGVAFVLFLYGLFPWIDNYAHIFGFVIGFLLSLALLPFLTFTEKVKRNIKVLLIWFCLAIVCIILIILLLFLYQFPIYDCKYCSYLNCIPFTPDWCSDHKIQVEKKDIL